MRNLNRRLDGLEATLAPESKPFLIWAMIDGRRMTDAEINEAFQEAIASGRASPHDKPLAISWMGDQLDARGSKLLFARNGSVRFGHQQSCRSKVETGSGAYGHTAYTPPVRGAKILSNWVRYIPFYIR
jgi:hypothetical protein